jgi:glycyl-tRNA synthetase
VEKFIFTPNKSVIGKALKKAGEAVIAHLTALPEAEAVPINDALTAGKSVTVTVDGEAHTITPEMCKWERVTVREHTRHFTPHVIEPAFGIGRIIYTILEHAFSVREEAEAKADQDDKGKKRVVLKLKPAVAPVKVAVLPLSNTDALPVLAAEVATLLTQVGVSSKNDSSHASIGRRYARADELGIPFHITVDFDTVKDRTVTLRERDSMLQVRLGINEVARVVADLAEGATTWDDVYAKFPHWAAGADN